MVTLRGAVRRVARAVLPKAAYDRAAEACASAELTLARRRHSRAFAKKGLAPVVMAFVVYLPQSWNSLKSVYRAAVEAGGVEPYLIVSPTRKGGQFELDEDVYAFFESEVPGAIRGIVGGDVFDLRTLEPDIVFRQSPYDHAYPRRYRAREIARYAKLCYVPYGYNYSPKKHLDIEYNRQFMLDLYAVFVEGATNRSYCEKLGEKLYPDLRVFDLGFPRFDLMREAGLPHRDGARTFLWIPRWSLDAAGNDASGFVDYVGDLVCYFSNREDLRLVIRPHPLMFENFTKLGVMDERAVTDFKALLDDIDNVELDGDMDYLPTFVEADALIADFSSLVFEFYLTKKPIVYCGSVEESNAETEKMMQLLYKASEWSELQRRIELLAAGEDERLWERSADVDAIVGGFPDGIGASIVEECVSFCR